LYGHRRLNPSLPPFTLRARGPLGPAAKGRNYPSLAKRGEGRFSEAYVLFIMDALVNQGFARVLWFVKGLERIVSREASRRVFIFKRYANDFSIGGLGWGVVWDGKGCDGGSSVDIPLPLRFF